MHDASGRNLEYESLRSLASWTKDNGGTPRDPGDDERIDWVVLEIGHVADYCAATVAAVTDQEQASRSGTAYPSWRTVASRILQPEIGRSSTGS